MRIKICLADKTFSQYIRKRDTYCVRCGGSGGLQCSHYFGRSRENTRFDPENCDTLCFGCHRVWGSDDKEGYRNFKINQLGEKGFDYLCIRANTYKRKDRKLALIYAKQLLEGLDAI